MINNHLKQKIRSWLSESSQVVIAGIGNPLRKDDFVGVRIVKDLKNKVASHVHLVECETVPESFLYSIVELNPSHILIIDAAMANLEPGNSKLVKPQKLQEYPTTSTHAIPLRIFCQYLLQETESKLALLIIQPEDASFGEGLTGKVKGTAKELTEFLLEILGTD